MRKSLPKTSHSELSSRVVSLPAGLLAVAVESRRAARPDGDSDKTNGGSNGRRQNVGPDQHRLAQRLRLLEGFVSRTDIADCAQHALQWLGDVTGLSQSACLVRSRGEQTLFTV